MSGLDWVSVLWPITASVWEILHRVADGAVIFAVFVGAREYWLHRGERRERTAAVDDHIHALGTLAYLRVHEAIESEAAYSEPVAARLMKRGTDLGDAMATLMTTIAAEAPRASLSVSRKARDAARFFLKIAIREALPPDDPNARTLNEAELRRLCDILESVLSEIKIPPERPRSRRPWRKFWGG
jgi:hypothetical protein